MKANKFDISNFRCQECGMMFPLPRPKSKKRERGHVKDLWCPNCGKTVKTIEYRNNDIYKALDGRILMCD